MRLTRTGLLSQSVALAASGVAGGVVALAGAALVGAFDGERTVTTVEVGDPGIAAPARFRRPEARSIGEIYRRARQGVVQVKTRSVITTTDPLGIFPERQEQEGLGSGFVIDKEGHIVTNYHVVQGAQEVEVSFSNRENVPAKVVGKDPFTDVAVLRVDAESRAFTPLPLGDSDDVEVGDQVVAIGNPLGYDRTVTAGIVSAVNRSIYAPVDQFRIGQVIQTDAAINQGNSGGPLLNSRGEVIGVNTQIATQNGGNIGIGFAVPINTVKDVAAEIIRDGKAEHAYLGISATPITSGIADLFHLPVKQGLLVASVAPGSGAAKAGVKAGTQRVTVEGETYLLGGDIVVKANGVPVGTVDRLRDVLADKEPGDKVELELYRGDEKKTVDVELGRQPTSPRG